MSTFSKKLVSGALMATTSVWMSGVLLLVPVAHAQVDLQAQIAALLAQIAQLQAQLNQQGGGMTSYSYTRDLTVGSRGDDVKALQQVLINKGYLTAVSAPTGYFGPATKAALAAWQSASGISPAAGYFGPKTRAAFAAMGGPVGGGTVPPVGGGTVPAPASGLWVAAAASNPAAGSLISSSASAAARVEVLAFTLTAGNSAPVTVTGLKFKKLGVLSDSSISSAYLIEGGKVVAQYSSLNQGVLDFPGVGLSIGAGQMRTFSLAIDPATGLSAGNTVSFALQTVTASDNSGNTVTAAGTLPLNGNIFTVTSVSNPAIASMTVTSSSIATTVTAGTQNSLVGAWNFNVSNSKVWLKGINFKVIGSANKSDLRNVMLKVNGTQIGQTLATVPADGSAYFDASATPGNLNTGSNNIQIFADVMGSPSYNFQFEILNSYDILAVDSQYNVPVSAESDTGSQVSISQGQITVSQATDTPTGTIAKGQSGVTLGKFAIYAAGEAIKVKFLEFTVTFTGTTTTLSNMLKNVSLVDDAGGQLGTTINTPPSSNTCTDSGAAAALSAAGVYRDCFGTSSSNVNYIIPANTTRVLSLKADVQSTAGFSSLVAALVASSNNNLQGLTSSQSNNSSGATGSTLTLASNSLTVSKNSAVGTQTMSGNSVGQRIGSYAFSAASAEGVSVSSINIQMSAATSTVQNLWVKVNGAQFGTSQGVLTASATYSFSGSAFTVPAGQTTIVDVYGDILSSAVAGTRTAITTVSGCAASGASSYTAISCSSTAGQDIVIAGQASITVSADTSLAAADQVVMNSSGNSLAYFRFTETSNIEDIKLDNLNVFQQVAGTSTVKSAFSSLTLYKSTDLSTPLATAGSANTAASSSNPGSGYYYKFSFANPVVVPQGGSVLLVLKGGVASYASSGATDNTTHVFKIATSTDSDNDTIIEAVDAKGKTSNASSSVTLSSANGSTMTVLRSKLSFTAAALGQASSRAKAPSDNLASLTFAADSAGDVAVNSVIVTFSGTAPSISSFLDGVTLLDESGNSLGTANATSSACNGTNTCTKTFNLGATTAGQIVTKGTSRTWTLRVDSTKTAAAIASISQTLTATINALTDIRYTDGLDSSAATTIGLASKVVVPITINSVSFSTGT